MSDYARKRAENIARNAEKLAELGIQDSSKFLRIPTSDRKRKKPKGYQPQTKRPREEPIVLRRSLRAQGISPEGAPREENHSSATKAEPEPEESDELDWDQPVLFSEVKDGDTSDDSLRSRISGAATGQPPEDTGNKDKHDDFDPLSLKLEEEDIVRLVPEKILSLMFLPLRTKVAVAAGDRTGTIGLWDADHKDESDENVLHIYRPHKKSVTAMASPPATSTQIATCSSDGSVLLMDIDKAAFSRVYFSDTSISAMNYLSSSTHTLFVGDYDGDIKLVDDRSSTVASHWKKPHEKRIHSIDTSLQRPLQVATCSGDGTVALWDVRVAKNLLATMSHKKSVHSAYFSPSGDRLASTSYDDHVGLWSGKQNDEAVMIRHNNQTNRWIATFRAIWSWSDNYVFIANMSRAIDVISTREKKVIASLRSEDMSSIPSRLARHPCLPGVVAGGTAGGKIFLWRA